MIRVLIVDDHPLVRNAIAQLLDAEDDIEVTAVAGTLAEARSRIVEETFDVAVIDLELPDGDGIDLAREIHALGIGTKVLILTGNEDRELLPTVLAAGSSGILVKRAHPEEVLTAVRTVAEGRSFIGVGLDPLELGRVFSEAANPDKGAGDDLLSPREKEVLVGVARGHTNQELGRKLGISPKTVATYRSRVAEKLDFGSRAELVRYALEAGLLKEED